MRKFSVTVRRMAECVVETCVDVEADSMQAAVQEALAQVEENHDAFTWPMADDTPTPTLEPAWAADVSDLDGVEVYPVDDRGIVEEEPL